MSTATITDAGFGNGVRLANAPVRPVRLGMSGAVLLLTAVVLANITSGGMTRFAHAYLLAISFCLTISLGALFFVILQHLTNARWSVSVRRVAELLTSAIPVLGLMFVPVLVSMLFGSAHLYAWNDPRLVETDELIRQKTAFLNAPFFAVRCLIYFGIWSLLSRFFTKNSLDVDKGPTAAIPRMRQYSGPAMMAFALTVNFAAFDLLMSLDPHWFSTIYGVYLFSGCTVAFFATLPLVTIFLQSRGALRVEITVEHYHDLGKLLFGFVFFWAYIAFSQYLLIWYANIPEETSWFAVRQTNGWQWVSLLLIVGHFILPFIGLMSRSARRSRRVLASWCVFLLLMHFFDLFWLVMPTASKNNALPQLIDVLCLAGVGLIWLAITLRSLSSQRLVSTGDPYLQESIAFHNA